MTDQDVDCRGRLYYIPFVQTFVLLARMGTHFKVVEFWFVEVLFWHKHLNCQTNCTLTSVADGRRAFILRGQPIA